MANNLFLPPVKNHTETVLRDLDGSEILRAGMDDFTMTDAQGMVTTHKSSECLTLVDGTVWNPGMSLRPNDPVNLAVCDLCRKPRRSFWSDDKPAHGIFALKNGKWCAGCGRMCCPRHIQVEPSDGNWRCPVCSMRYRRAGVLHSIFFRRVERR